MKQIKQTWKRCENCWTSREFYILFRCVRVEKKLLSRALFFLLAILHMSVATIMGKLPPTPLPRVWESKSRLVYVRASRWLKEALKYSRVRSITLTNFIIHESIIHVVHNSPLPLFLYLKPDVYGP